MPILGVVASSISGNLNSLVGSYDALATATVPSGGLTAVTFAGIPNGYKYLQVRATYQLNTADSDWLIRFNGDTGANYSKHQVWGDGTSPYASATASTSGVSAGVNREASVYTSTSVTDILDYAETTKNKTARTLTGSDSSGTGFVFLRSGAWYNTAAITSITLVANATTFNQHSTFALYGVR